MTKDEAMAFILHKQPQLIYLSGKTCTGKSTFANSLQNIQGYRIVELDTIVQTAVIAPLGLAKQEGDVFVSVYKTGDNSAWIERFVHGVDKQLRQGLADGVKIIVEGAIANPLLLQRIFASHPDAAFVYFHPTENSTNYTRNILQRFKETNKQHRNGLPNGFWQCIDGDAFAAFCADGVITPKLREGIAIYANKSAKDSAKRLKIFEQLPFALQVVTV